MAGLDPTVDVPPGLPAAVRRLADGGEPRRAGELIPDHLLDRFAFAGTPDDVARQAEALVAAGASRVEFGTPHGLTDERGVELLSAHVVPRFRCGGVL